MSNKKPDHIPDVPFMLKIFLLAGVLVLGTFFKGQISNEPVSVDSYASKERTKPVKDQDNQFRKLTHKIFMKSE